MNLHKYTDINQFVAHSFLGDGHGAHRAGILRLNRFVGLMSVSTSEFLAWNIFKVSCPTVKLGIKMNEVDMIPRYYFENWEFADLSVSFLESSDLTVRQYFFDWMNKALNIDTYNRQYFDAVKASSFKIYPLDNAGNAVVCDAFYDIVPYEVSTIEYDVSDEGAGVALTTVKFNYMKHKVEKL